MKLSEIKGERVFDVIADIIEPVATIAQDKEAMKLFSSEGKPEEMSGWEWFVERAKTAVPVLMKTYKHELCVILATVNDVTVEEYVEGLSVPKLFANVLDLVTDSEFISFFS
jgi:hypothetical protein